MDSHRHRVAPGGCRLAGPATDHGGCAIRQLDGLLPLLQSLTRLSHRHESSTVTLRTGFCITSWVLAVRLALQRLAASVRPTQLVGSTFYPCRPILDQAPLTAFANRRLGSQICEKRTHLSHGVLAECPVRFFGRFVPALSARDSLKKPHNFSLLMHPPSDFPIRLKPSFSLGRSLETSPSRSVSAPCGRSPFSTYFQALPGASVPTRRSPTLRSRVFFPSNRRVIPETQFAVRLVTEPAPGQLHMIHRTRRLPVAVEQGGGDDHHDPAETDDPDRAAVGVPRKAGRGWASAAEVVTAVRSTSGWPSVWASDIEMSRFLLGGRGLCQCRREPSRDLAREFHRRPPGAPRHGRPNTRPILRRGRMTSSRRTSSPGRDRQCFKARLPAAPATSEAV